MYQQRNNKNQIIAVVLDIIGGLIYYFLCGIGQIYLGLYKRAIVLCLLGFVPMVVGALLIIMDFYYLGIIASLILGIGLTIYSAYDAYICTQAINEGRPIPLLFGSLDIQ